MLLRFCLCCAALALALQPAAFAGEAARPAESPPPEELYEILRGVFLASRDRHLEAADALAAAGKRLQSGKVMEAATQAAVLAKDFDRAQRYALQWMEAGGGIRAQQVAAEMLIYNNRLPQAEELLADLTGNKGQPPASLYLQLAAAKQPAEALAAGARLFPPDAEGRYQLARLGLHFRDFNLARRELNAALQQDELRPEFHLLNAYLSGYENGAANAALPVLEKFAAANCYGVVERCELPALLAAYADYIRAGEWQAGAEADAAREHFAAGVLFENWDMPERAKKEYEKLPEHFHARLGLARIYEQEGDVENALEILRNTPVANNNVFVSRETAIARLLQQAKQQAAAINRLQDALTTAPDEYTLLYLLSLLLEEDGQVAEALEVLRKITRLFPDNADGWNALGYVMADHNIDLAAAKVYIERALAMRPEDPNIIDSIGWLYYRMGDLAAARRYLEQAAALSDSAEIAAHLGEVLWEIGETEKAAALWKQTLERHPDNKVLNAALERYQPF